MRRVISAVIIEDKKILLVRKKETWILPGGKPEPGESDIECLIREVSEELSGVVLQNIRFYGKFEGIAPHQKDLIEINVYTAGIQQGAPSPNAEINACEWYDGDEGYNLADSLDKIIGALRKDNYL